MRGKIVGDEFGTRTLFCSNSMMNWKHFSYEDPFFFSSLVARRTLIIVELCAQLKHRKSIWLRAIYNKKKPKSLKCKENKRSFNTFIIVKFVWSNFSLALVIVFLLVEFEFFFRSEKSAFMLHFGRDSSLVRRHSWLKRSYYSVERRTVEHWKVFFNGEKNENYQS